MLKNKMKAVISPHAADKDGVRDAVFAQVTASVPCTKKPRFARLLTACVALILLFCAGGGVAIAVEAAEYNSAVEFFEENGLSSDGLSRNELKAVYRDITQKTFSYEKTVEVLNEYSIKTYSIKIDATDSKSLASWWENRKNFSSVVETVNAVYDFVRVENVSPSLNNIIRYVDGVEDWTVTLPVTERFFFFKKLIPYKDGVIVCGNEIGDSNLNELIEDVVLYRYSAEGELLYKKRIKQVGSNFRACLSDDTLIIANQDAQVTDTEEKAVHITTVNAENGELASRKNTLIDYDRFTVFNIMPFGEGYLLHLTVREEKYLNEFHTIANWVAKFIKCSADFEPIEEISVLMEETAAGKEVIYSYSATLNGRFYAVATLSNTEGWEKFTEDYKKEHGKYPGYPENYKFIAEENYESLLLAFDSDGTISEAYSVDNAWCVQEMSGALTVTSDGNLSWRILVYSGEVTNEIPDDKPYLSGSNAFLHFVEYEFLFDKDGNLLSQTPLSSGWDGIF